MWYYSVWARTEEMGQIYKETLGSATPPWKPGAARSLLVEGSGSKAFPPARKILQMTFLRRVADMKEPENHIL